MLLPLNTVLKDGDLNACSLWLSSYSTSKSDSDVSETNKNYYVVRNAGWARSRNTWQLSHFFLIMNESSVSRTAHPPLKKLQDLTWPNVYNVSGKVI